MVIRGKGAENRSADAEENQLKCIGGALPERPIAYEKV